MKLNKFLKRHVDPYQKICIFDAGSDYYENPSDALKELPDAKLNRHIRTVFTVGFENDTLQISLKSE